MKNILGHRSWNEQEVIDILRRTGTFTMCNLPHYRYDRVKSICRKLRKKGWIKESGRTNEGINWRATPTFHQWAWFDGSDLV